MTPDDVVGMPAPDGYAPYPMTAERLVALWLRYESMPVARLAIRLHDTPLTREAIHADPTYRHHDKVTQCDACWMTAKALLGDDSPEFDTGRYHGHPPVLN